MDASSRVHAHSVYFVHVFCQLKVLKDMFEVTQLAEEKKKLIGHNRCDV